MKTNKLIIMGVLGLLAWFAMGLNLAWAQGAVIFPVDSNGSPLPNSAITISILDPNGNDITGAWLPKPDQKVIIRVNEAKTSDILVVPSEVPDPTVGKDLTTSAYPGQCTNFGDETGADFEFIPPNILMPKDSGGMAVVQVTGTDNSGANFDHLYIIPGDEDFDGIADNFEKLYCQDSICLYPDEDEDMGPEPESAMGDGISARDEYRGFKASGNYIRTDPRVKDLFVNLVAEPNGVLNTLFDDLNALFENMDNFSTGLQVHRINNDEWIDHFDHYSPIDGLQLTQGSDEAKDRQITRNALVDMMDMNPPLEYPVKGIRLIECVDSNASSPLGLALKKAPPNNLGKEYGNAVIFTQRISESYNSKFSYGGNRKLSYYTYDGRWSEVWAGDSSPPSDDEKNFILKKALSCYAAHEATGHSLDLTSVMEYDKKNPVGYHHVSGTGTNIDIRIEQIVDRKDTGFNKFYIPRSFGISDKRDMRILSSQ